MSIGFRVKTDEELSAEFRALTDTHLIETGKMLRDFAKPRPGQGPDENWLRQLKSKGRVEAKVSSQGWVAIRENLAGRA
jgi:hypothetical protein